MPWIVPQHKPGCSKPGRLTMYITATTELTVDRAGNILAQEGDPDVEDIECFCEECCEDAVWVDKQDMTVEEKIAYEEELWSV